VLETTHCSQRVRSRTLNVPVREVETKEKNHGEAAFAAAQKRRRLCGKQRFTDAVFETTGNAALREGGHSRLNSTIAADAIAPTVVGLGALRVGSVCKFARFKWPPF
jgi:hypothetical protein